MPTLVDLTHTLTQNSPSWGGGCGFKLEIKKDYADSTDDVKFRVQQLKMHAGIGTHMDAPAHCIPGGKTIDQFDINEFLAPLVVIDVSAKVHERYKVSVDDIQQFELQCGKIPPKALVLIYTGWERFWLEPKKYHNNHVFPCIAANVAELLLAKKIVGLGIDTLSPDRPEEGFAVHQLVLGAGQYIIENVANANKLPPLGAKALALPLKLQGATEAPLRLVGLI
jgi:kynurenine formamidase